MVCVFFVSGGLHLVLEQAAQIQMQTDDRTPAHEGLTMDKTIRKLQLLLTLTVFLDGQVVKRVRINVAPGNLEELRFFINYITEIISACLAAQLPILNKRKDSIGHLQVGASYGKHNHLVFDARGLIPGKGIDIRQWMEKHRRDIKERVIAIFLEAMLDEVVWHDT